MKIIGAGLSGLLAGAMFPGSTIYEQQDHLPHNHGAVLRFRSNKISEALGIPFKKVRVTKSIWYRGEEVQPTPRFQNMYSQKVLREYTSRSIADIDPVNRWIAPDDFIELLAKRCDIKYNWPFTHPSDQHIKENELIDGPWISTIPMPVMLNLIGDTKPPPANIFLKRPIWTHEYNFSGIDLYQTIYFPYHGINIYRASFTGSKFIVEMVADPMVTGIDIEGALEAFGIDNQTWSEHSSRAGTQEYGKLIPINNDLRRKIMADLTHDYNIYSLGRYATWRNILLDDVFNDIRRIKDMIQMDSYSRRMALSEEK